MIQILDAAIARVHEAFAQAIHLSLVFSICKATQISFFPKHLECRSMTNLNQSAINQTNTTLNVDLTDYATSLVLPPHASIKRIPAVVGFPSPIYPQRFLSPSPLVTTVSSPPAPRLLTSNNNSRNIIHQSISPSP